MEATHGREPWNKGKLIGPKPPLKRARRAPLVTPWARVKIYPSARASFAGAG